MRRCIICDKECKPELWLCAECYAQWGSYDEWPAWLKELFKMERRYRAQPGGITQAPADIEVVHLWHGG